LSANRSDASFRVKNKPFQKTRAHWIAPLPYLKEDKCFC
jgi:hypothetical protein